MRAPRTRHQPPAEPGNLGIGECRRHAPLDGVLAELRRAMAPVEAFAERLRQAGFTEVERRRRPGIAEPGRRPHAAIAAIAS